MVTTVNFFPVGNGDMTLIELESGRRLLIDVNIRSAADGPDDDTPDVAEMLRNRLLRDDEDRLYVDGMLLSHPDRDHCAGLRKHFHLGAPSEWSKSADKIFIREIWSSPMVFRRASRTHVLCDDADAFCAEAQRRVRQFRDSGGMVAEGDRVLILGEDEGGKTDDLTAILITIDSVFSRINGQHDETFSARLLAPRPKSSDETEEEARAKNRSSTILNLAIAGQGVARAGRFLTGGDAGVAIWEKLWQRHWSHADWLDYDLLQAPHHCSWRSLSYDSWSEMGEDAKVCEDARKALSQARDGAIIIASSCPILDDDNDPPCIRAKREYTAIVRKVRGSFRCVGDSSDMLVYEIRKDGPRLKTPLMKSASVVGTGLIGRQPLAHG
jgi:glyoxylase-like metal-dependent hydrolase (beta-lactamase superfamily II)